MCEPTEPCTESEAGGSTVSFVQRSRCVRLVSYRLREQRRTQDLGGGGGGGGGARLWAGPQTLTARGYGGAL